MVEGVASPLRGGAEAACDGRGRGGCCPWAWWLWSRGMGRGIGAVRSGRLT